MSARVFVTGLGAISAIGNNVAENLHSLLGSRHGIGPITLLNTSLSDLPAGEIKLSNNELHALCGLPARSFETRTMMLALLAAREAHTSAHCSTIKAKTAFISALPKTYWPAELGLWAKNTICRAV